jgi:amidase
MASATKRYTIEESRAFIQSLVIPPKHSGTLSGLRFAVKDLIDVAGYKTSCGNPDWRDTHPPAAANATCVEQLLENGGECVGKTVTDELAFGINGENFFYGTPLNPKAPDRIPGGSSCGSASAVACGLVDFAVGSDTGGSVRVPASNCGIFGMRPSHGFISVAGVNPFAPNFDTVGILARSVDILVQAMSILLAREVEKRTEIGTIYVVNQAWDIVNTEVKQALIPHLKSIEAVAQQVRNIGLQEIDSAGSQLQSWYDTFCILQWTEIWSCLGSWVEEKKPRFGPRTKANFELAKNADRSKISELSHRREQYFNSMQDFLGPNDLLCIPSVPEPAPLKGSLGIDRTKGTYYPRAISLTSLAGVARLPENSLPLAGVNGLPIGLSLLGRHGRDTFLLSAAKQFVDRSH